MKVLATSYIAWSSEEKSGITQSYNSESRVVLSFNKESEVTTIKPCDSILMG